MARRDGGRNGRGRPPSRFQGALLPLSPTPSALARAPPLSPDPRVRGHPSVSLSHPAAQSPTRSSHPETCPPTFLGSIVYSAQLATSKASLTHPSCSYQSLVKSQCFVSEISCTSLLSPPTATTAVTSPVAVKALSQQPQSPFPVSLTVRLPRQTSYIPGTVPSTCH